MAESFDAAKPALPTVDSVLADMRRPASDDPREIEAQAFLDYYADRLQSAHEAEVAEVRESARHEAVAMGLLADRAVALLQRWASTRHYTDLALLDETDAFLSEQAGERENGDG